MTGLLEEDQTIDERSVLYIVGHWLKKNMKWTQKERIMSVRDYFLITGLAFNT